MNIEAESGKEREAFYWQEEETKSKNIRLCVKWFKSRTSQKIYDPNRRIF